MNYLGFIYFYTPDVSWDLHEIFMKYEKRTCENAGTLWLLNATSGNNFFPLHCGKDRYDKEKLLLCFLALKWSLHSENIGNKWKSLILGL